jgi:class 3 adenylate cyclase/CHASE2 domain-containing sensor protein
MTSLKRRLGLGIMLVAILGGTLALPRVFSPVAAIESWITDLVTVFATPREPLNPDVVVLTLTEDTLAQFPYRSPVDRAFLAELLRAVGRAGARGVGFDVLFDQPTEPEKDAALSAAFKEVGIPVVVAWGDARAGLTPEQSAFLAEYTKPVQTGFANLLKDDQDGTTRRIFPPEDGRASLPGALARALGARIPEHEAPIVYRRGPAGEAVPFAAYPAHTVPFLPPEWLKGKAVLIGSDLPQEDRHRTPFAAAYGNVAGTIPGVYIHAQALAQMLDGRHRPVWALWQEAALVAALAGFGLLIETLALPIAASAALSLAALAVPWAGGYALAASGGPAPAPLSPSLALIFALAVGSSLVGRHERAQKRFVEQAFRRYVSPAVLTEIQADPSRLRLGGERRDVTYVFTDIAGFTTLSETMPPDVIAGLLNAYLDGMSGIVLEHDGTIDKFIGDAVVALFGAPLAHDDDPDRAVACAIAMDALAARFRAEHAEVGFGLTRVGVNTGPVVVGNFGGSARFDYTAIGDTVNTASRLEGVNKYLGTRIAVGAETVLRCTRHRFLPVAGIVLKGKTQPIPVFTPIAAGDDPVWVEGYLAAYAALEAGDPAAAGARLAALAEHPLVALHRRRLAEGATDAVLVMTDK